MNYRNEIRIVGTGLNLNSYERRKEKTMDRAILTRRTMLQTSAALGAAALSALGSSDGAEAAARPGKTPPLTSEEIAAIDAAMGKKGTYNEAQATHTVALPRSDLK